MRIAWLVPLLAAVLLLAGCGGGGGSTPRTGGAYVTISWTADVQAADFTQIGVPSPFAANTAYPLQIGSGRVFWASDWLGSCCTSYFLDVVVEGGTPGDDRVYTAVISQDTLYSTSALVPFAAASSTGVTDAPVGARLSGASAADEAAAQPGRLLVW
ncbi:MAG TPA: hypothetical protein VKB51_15095 [bacterium]|nr:hypothetical protein [bacterium]